MERLENTKGQNTIEYLLVFAVVLMVICLLLSPKEGGFFRGQLDNALDLSMEGVECIAASVCYKTDGCGDPCGDGCCQEGERQSCPQDCTPATGTGMQCIRDPSLGPCNITDCHEGCEIVTVDAEPGECHWENHVMHCSPGQPAYSTCNELPCAGDNQSECEFESYCVWR